MRYKRSGGQYHHFAGDSDYMYLVFARSVEAARNIAKRAVNLLMMAYVIEKYPRNRLEQLKIYGVIEIHLHRFRIHNTREMLLQLNR